MVVKEAPAPKAQKEPAENTKEADSKTSTDWWMVWLTGILAFVAFLQLIVFGLQARRLRQTIETMKNIGADQSRDMQASIAAAEKSADIAERTIAATQRPWISIDIRIDDKQHHTGFITELKRRRRADYPPDIEAEMLSADEATVDAADLLLFHSPWGSPTID